MASLGKPFFYRYFRRAALVSAFIRPTHNVPAFFGMMPKNGIFFCFCLPLKSSFRENDLICLFCYDQGILNGRFECCRQHKWCGHLAGTQPGVIAQLCCEYCCGYRYYHHRLDCSARDLQYGKSSDACARQWPTFFLRWCAMGLSLLR